MLFAHCATVMLSADPTWLTVDWTGLESVQSDAILRLLVLVCSLPSHNCAVQGCSTVYWAVQCCTLSLRLAVAGKGCTAPLCCSLFTAPNTPKINTQPFLVTVVVCGSVGRQPAPPPARPAAHQPKTEGPRLKNSDKNLGSISAAGSHRPGTANCTAGCLVTAPPPRCRARPTLERKILRMRPESLLGLT